MAKTDRAAVARAVEELLRALGHDPEREAELRGTGARVADLWLDELIAGEGIDLGSLFEGAIACGADAPLVVVERLATHVVCPHHLTIGQGFASIAYLPGGRVAGLGAIAELVDACCKRLVLQEDAGRDVARALCEHLGARGAACRLELRHGCLELHGPKKRGARVTTLALAGCFERDPAERALAVAALIGPSERRTSSKRAAR